MFNVSDEKMLNTLYDQAIIMREDSNHSVMILINFMKKKDHWAPYIIDQVKGTKGIRGSSESVLNHSSVKHFVM